MICWNNTPAKSMARPSTRPWKDLRITITSEVPTCTSLVWAGPHRGSCPTGSGWCRHRSAWTNVGQTAVWERGPWTACQGRQAPSVYRRRPEESGSASSSSGRSWCVSGSCSRTWRADRAAPVCWRLPRGSTSSGRWEPCSTCWQSEITASETRMRSYRLALKDDRHTDKAETYENIREIRHW